MEPATLEAVVRERLVGLGHTMHVFTLLDCRAFAFNGIKDLTSQPQRHGLFTTITSGIHQPAHGKRCTTTRSNLYGHLVSCTTHTPGLHFDRRAQCIQSFFKHFDGILLAALSYLFERSVDNTLSDGLLAAFHHMIDEFSQNLAMKLRIRQNLALRRNSSSWHN